MQALANDGVKSRLVKSVAKYIRWDMERTIARERVKAKGAVGK